MGGWAYRGVGDEIEEGNMRGREGGKSKGSVWLEIERRFPLKRGVGDFIYSMRERGASYEEAPRMDKHGSLRKFERKLHLISSPLFTAGLLFFYRGEVL